MNRSLNRGGSGGVQSAPCSSNGGSGSNSDLHTVSGRMSGGGAEKPVAAPLSPGVHSPPPLREKKDFQIGRKQSAPSQAVRSASFL